eukprot:scaffold14616_cov50-Phaeocystis_antarctica.AAC.2
MHVLHAPIRRGRSHAARGGGAGGIAPGRLAAGQARYLVITPAVVSSGARRIAPGCVTPG